MNRKEEIIATYDASALKKSKRFHELGARVEDIERAFELAGKDNPNVLEIGCGDGRDAKKIIQRTKQYLGVDISSRMIDVAREYVPEASFEVADIEEYIFPKELDIIFSFASLLFSDKEHIKNIFQHAHGALNDGGIFYISLKYGEYREETKTDEFGTRTFYYYTPEVIKELAGDKYTTAFESAQELRGQKWLTIALRKIV